MFYWYVISLLQAFLKPFNCRNILMKVVKESIRQAFLLSPHKLQETHIILQTLSIVKKK